MSDDLYLGIGIYTVPEVARILQAPPDKVRRWINDFYLSPNPFGKPRGPIVRRRFIDAPVITFIELIELLFVKVFRDHDVSMQTIRKASARAAEKFGTDYPFAVQQFDTDGRRIFATLVRDADTARSVEDVTNGQLAFETVVRPFFLKIDFRGDEAARYWPRERDGRVVIDPQRSFGKPIDAETGVPTEVIYDAVMAGGGQSLEVVADWFSVPVDAVIAATGYEQSLRDI